jgi:hypothetical protein
MYVSWIVNYARVDCNITLDELGIPNTNLYILLKQFLRYMKPI